MNVAVMRTKAEQSLNEGFAAYGQALPGGPQMLALRRAALARFMRVGLPNRRTEAYKYTDLRERLKAAPAPAPLSVPKGPLPVRLDDYVQLVFIDGGFAAAHRLEGAGHGRDFHFDPLAKLLAGGTSAWLHSRLEATLESSGAVAALNTAYMSDGVVLRIVEGAHVIVPIGLTFLASGGAPIMTSLRNLIHVGANARVTFVESHAETATTRKPEIRGSIANAMTEIDIGDGAHVEHITIVSPGSDATHLGTCQVSLGKGATYRGFQLTHDTGLARHDIAVTFKGKRATLDLAGLMLARGHEHIDTTLTIDHAVPNGTSRELYKAVLTDHARAVFQGKVIVRPQAQKSDGKQMAKALMLSPDAEFDSKPELEIYADDVVCGHGSTVAELDADLLFYCQSRGIPKSEARRLLVASFVGEAVDKVEHEVLRAAIRATADGWLDARKEEPA